MPVRGKLSHNDNNQILGRVNHEYNSNPGVRFIIYITPRKLTISAKAVTVALEGKPQNGRSRGEGTRKSSSLMAMLGHHTL